MGAWGAEIFSDDTACDVRDGYLDLLGEGHANENAVDLLQKEWAESLKDEEEAAVFWLALADTQWQHGRLQDHVRQKALAVIAGGADLKRWEENPDEHENRKAELERLQKRLQSPQPPQKKIEKKFKSDCDWERGELISYRLSSGDCIVFRVLGLHVDRGGASPVCEILNWKGKEIPSKFVLYLKGVRQGKTGQPIRQVMLAALKPQDFPAHRVQRLGMKMRPFARPGGYTVFFWKQLDEQLAQIFQIS